MKKVRVEKKLELLLFVFFFLIYIPFSSSQIQDHGVNAEHRLRYRPRNKRDYAKPGHYEIAVSLNKSQLNPGDSFQAGAYVTGYGKIGGSKVAIFSSNTEIFDTSSEVLTDLYPVQDSLKYGGQSSKFSTVNCIINLSGGIKFGRKDSTFDDNYFDANLDTNNLTIITELQVERTCNIKY